MIAGRNVVTFRSASSPSRRFVGLKPQAWTSSASPDRVAGSSSTIRTRSPFDGSVKAMFSSVMFILCHSYIRQSQMGRNYMDELDCQG